MYKALESPVQLRGGLEGCHDNIRVSLRNEGDRWLDPHTLNRDWLVFRPGQRADAAACARFQLPGVAAARSRCGAATRGHKPGDGDLIREIRPTPSRVDGNASAACDGPAPSAASVEHWARSCGGRRSRAAEPGTAGASPDAIPRYG